VKVIHPAGGADETMTSLGLPQFPAVSGQRLAMALVDFADGADIKTHVSGGGHDAGYGP